MFIVFEGIDGGGKTTLSNRLARRLSRLGHRVCHAREGGELQSATARRIRELTRDPRLLEMCPQAEFLLNLARDSQQLDEVIRPALERGEICIADRYLFSQLALTAGGRGLPEGALRPALELASQGVWPDLVVLVDVEPEVARLRKRVAKLSSGREGQPDSRKGLAGAGLAVRARKTYLDLARREPARWLVLDNTSQPLWVVEQQMVEAVLACLEGGSLTAGSQRRDPARASHGSPAAGVRVSCEDVEQRFFEALDELEAREPQLCAYLLIGIPGLTAHRRRLSYVEQFPALVARGVAGSRDEESLALRQLLADRAPREVAQGLTGDGSSEAMELRRSLFSAAPAEVLASLKRLDTAEAWEFREQALGAGELAWVLPGLGGLDCERAWELRQRGFEEELPFETARSLSGLSAGRADALREQLFRQDRLAALKSAGGLDSPYIQSLRERLFPLAPKLVLRSMSGVSAPYAYELRERAAPLTKEALDSIDGLDDEAAWALREKYARSWPSTAVSSVKSLSVTPRGRALIDGVLQLFPGRLAVLRNAYAVMAKGLWAEARRTDLPQAAMVEQAAAGGSP
ncbi:MAG: dTMP kinase [Myxococcales bacterium]|nr:dTMP kinase [Myxococcales bacterium]